ncbi:ExeA family protein [Aquamicrobium zhengzhouense]|uniref:AAA family ATPase n=1 Tax=Aquamicrobium zhengzhouense TaxID=2781738 RepID=A0ABS0S8W5_9HYPH|nr:AAA family ATPase [Aquamicrobium zhengzhouense]MBI1619239.1 AAA family ATPase [Aquamicrobium zhengzhouense]
MVVPILTDENGTAGGVPEADKPTAKPAGGLYLQHFGLTERPFSLQPDPAYLFWSDAHARAYAMLEYGLASFAPIIVITGEIGAGKTTLVRHLLSSAPDNLHVGLVSNAHGHRGQILQWILRALGDQADGPMSYVKRFSRFEEYLRRQTEAGNRTLLVFDEAQNLSEKMLEELRCFSNLNGGNVEMLQILLVGQPELNDMLARPRLLQFAQRVSAKHHLPGMPAEAVRPYITHRLATAGARSWIFTPGACDLVASSSGGLPRVINQICDYALVYAFAEGRTVVANDLVEQVIEERGIRALVPRPEG